MLGGRAGAFLSDAGQQQPQLGPWGTRPQQPPADWSTYAYAPVRHTRQVRKPFKYIQKLSFNPKLFDFLDHLQTRQLSRAPPQGKGLLGRPPCPPSAGCPVACLHHPALSWKSRPTVGQELIVSDTEPLLPPTKVPRVQGLKAKNITEPPPPPRPQKKEKIK